MSRSNFIASCASRRASSDLEVVESTMESFAKGFRGCVGWAGESSENGKVGEIVWAKVNLSLCFSGACSAVCGSASH